MVKVPDLTVDDPALSVLKLVRSNRGAAGGIWAVCHPTREGSARACSYSPTTLMGFTSSTEKRAVSPSAVSILQAYWVFLMFPFDSTWYRAFRKSVVVTSATGISLGVLAWNAAGGKTSGNASGCKRMVSDRSRSVRERRRLYRKRIFCHGQALSN